jgi:hypothetical protein
MRARGPPIKIMLARSVAFDPGSSGDIAFSALSVLFQHGCAPRPRRPSHRSRKKRKGPATGGASDLSVCTLGRCRANLSGGADGGLSLRFRSFLLNPGATRARSLAFNSKLCVGSHSTETHDPYRSSSRFAVD